MVIKSTLFVALMFSFAHACVAQEKTHPTSVELGVLKASIGVWDAEIEVWPAGLESASIKFKGVETNRSYGEHWIASDFDSEFMGQTMKVHSIIGYDLDRKKLVGTVIDHSPYPASMTGKYDKDSKTIQWKTEAKTPDGNSIVQQTSVTQEKADERVLVLSVPGKQKDEFTKFMQIKFVKRELVAE